MQRFKRWNPDSIDKIEIGAKVMIDDSDSHAKLIHSKCKGVIISDENHFGFYKIRLTECSGPHTHISLEKRRVITKAY